MTATNAAFRQSFGDFEAFVASMGRSGGTVVPMAPGPWHASLAMVRVEGLQLYWADVPPQIRDGAVTPGDMLMVSRAPPGAVLHLGHEFRPGEISLLGEGTVIESRFRHPTVWSGVQFEPDGLARLLHGWTPRLPRRGQHAILRIEEREQASLMAELESRIVEALRTPELLLHPATAAALQESVLHAVARSFAVPGRWTEQPRATSPRRRIARMAVEILTASPAADWRLSRLADALGIAPRTLHAAFAAVYGCSPHAFIKRWRLVMVRRALLARGEELLVKTAALDHGFWHLGHFAGDYRALFGESPQETRRRRDRRLRGWSPVAA